MVKTKVIFVAEVGKHEERKYETMKIRLAIVDSDSSYQNRLVNALNNKYQESLEVHAFSNRESLLAALDTIKADVLIADASFELDATTLPGNCCFAYMTDDRGITAFKGQHAIGKYQKVDSIYNRIMDLYAESGGVAVGTAVDGDLPLYVFTSASGGVGTSAAAVGYAKSLAALGKNALYMNLEKLGTPGLYFTGEGSFTMRDLMIAIKSKRAGVALKLKSNVRRDASGVYWYGTPHSPIDLQELNKEDIHDLYLALSQTGMFERLVIDLSFAVDECSLALMQQASAIIFVSDGTTVATEKFKLAYRTLALLEQEKNIGFLSRIILLYNKFSNKSGQLIEDHSLRSIGGIARIEHATTEQVISHIMKHEGFASL